MDPTGFRLGCGTVSGSSAVLFNEGDLHTRLQCGSE